MRIHPYVAANVGAAEKYNESLVDLREVIYL
jgi:hypothetical protein